MRPVLRLAVLAPALLAAACSSYNPLVWVGIMSTPANPPTPLAPIEAKVTPRAVWTASVGKSKGFNLRPAIDTALIVTGRVRRSGRLVGVVDIDVANENGQLVAIGRATYATAA